VTPDRVEVRARGRKLPAALARLHGSMIVGQAAEVVFTPPAGPVTATDLLVGAGFDVLRAPSAPGEGWRARRARSLPDTVGAGLRLLVCGLNPSEHAADAGVGYVTPGNRFWPAALEAGLVSRDRDPWHALTAHGVGMSDVVKRATPRADALTRDEYRAGMGRLERLCSWLRPGVVVFVGLAGWRAAVDPGAVAGQQPVLLGGRPVYVLPSTSGLNAATPLPALVEHLRSAVDLAATD
jgi:TDG/mug DNA glycosylase family protein